MTHVRFDDSTPWHPRVLAMSDAEFRAWFNSICYASRFRTDGKVPKTAISSIGASAPTCKALVKSGAWEPNGDGVYVHDYLHYQRSREQIEAVIQAAKGAAETRWRKATS